MELRHLKYFVAVAEELHFRRAAQILHVAQPALSHQIRQLEEEIGAVLLHRGQHKVQLTPAGRVFLVKARAILKDAQNAILDTRAVEHGEEGTMAIGFVSTAAIRVLPQLLARVRKQTPRAEVVLRALGAGEQIDCLYRSSLDLGLFHASFDEACFDSLVVARDKLVVALPKASRLARRSVVNLEDLGDEAAIMPARHSTVGYYELVQMAYQAAGVQPRRIHHSGQLQTGLLLVGAGLGVSLVPESWKDIRVTGVVYRPLTTDLAPVDLLAVWRRDNTSALLRRIITHLEHLRPV